MPGQSPAEVEDQVVRLRKELADQGSDNGPDPIRWALLAQPDPFAGGAVPGHDRADLDPPRAGQPGPEETPALLAEPVRVPPPDDCWQSDWTSWALADGSPVAIAGTLDDHSRYLGGLRAGPGDADAGLVWATMTAAIGECGLPARSLTDNGLVYTGRFINATVAFETNLAALGVQTLNSRPFHPQTCGKIERHWQTLKRWLRAHDPASTMTELNTQLEAYRDFYNHRRPHRAHRGQTPGAVFAATAKARPATRPLPVPLIITSSQVTPTGVATVGSYDINVGRRWAGHHLDVIRDGEHLTLFSGTRLVRELTINPHRPLPTRPPRYDLRGHREPMTP